ncbi:hypothetical protein [Pseudovibrio sp. Ad26]|uniref:hypothetical protein n=1 Tax=Pseudovibrio sp. Ad26 TaxID=989410 RepID=UPI0007AE4B9A|nr:hypothetical protein [Pseudovibrio sp. Ad26]KZL16140.1 hypothetical protein PsAD26_00842 [Pseudovibrio sp. Ad26]
MTDNLISRDANPLILARLPISSGLILGILSLTAHFFLPLELSHQFAAIVLVLIAGVYIGYAFKDGRMHTILTEVVVASLFGAAALLGLNGYPMAIVGAFVAHGLWDVLHHNLIDTHMPRWYIPFCAVYDVGAALGLLAIWMLYF